MSRNERPGGGGERRAFGREFVFLAAVQFDHCLSGRTRRLAETLAGMGCSVSFVEMPSLRVSLRCLRRSVPRARMEGGVQVLRLWPLPGPLGGSANFAKRSWCALAARALRSRIPSMGAKVIIASTPWWIHLVSRLPRSLLLYDYIDHVGVHAGAHLRRFEAWDERLLGASDAVACVSETLRRGLLARTGSRPVHLIPNGVDSKWIDSPIPSVPREMLAASPGVPIVGFVGAVVLDWVDVDLLARTARALPRARFAVVGPAPLDGSLKELLDVGNVRFLGPKPHPEVPAWIKAMDVCLIPFKRNELARAADPIKLYEYCALGKPVVSTVRQDLPGDPAPVKIASSDEEFIAGVKSALAEGDPTRRADRIAFAARHTWDRRALDFLAAVDLALEGKGSGRRV